MSKNLIAIGVNKSSNTTDFAVLHAAAQGAIAIVDWAKKHDFDVKLFSDDKGSPVKFDDINAAVNDVVNSGTCEQLVIYFSGHGLMPAAGAEVWLLSGAPRQSQIPHIVVISDACRNTENDAMAMGLSFSPCLFPTKENQNVESVIDIIYATGVGKAALELLPDSNFSFHRSALTYCLLEVLKGNFKAITEDFTDGSNTKTVLTTRGIADCLKTIVPKHVAESDFKLAQFPVSNIQSALPKYLVEIQKNEALVPKFSELGADNALAVVVTNPALSTILSDPGFTLSGKLTTPKSKSRQSTRRKKTTALEPINDWRNEIFKPISANKLSVSTLQNLIPDQYKQSINEIVASPRRTKFETLTGFSVYGARIHSASVSSGQCEFFESENYMAIRIDSMPTTYENGSNKQSPGSILIQFENGTGCVLSIFNGMIGSVIFQNGHIATINYTPAEYTTEHQIYSQFASNIEKRRALIAVAARDGAFHVNKSNAEEMAVYLREYKDIDPTLGLYAAYAYAQAGLSEMVFDVFKYMDQQSTGAPFDVAILAANNAPINWGQKPLNYSPWLPMLTQGWFLLGKFESAIPTPIKEARNFLIPGLWTTFHADGIEILRKAYFPILGEKI
jgi:hypothetical protein